MWRKRESRRGKHLDPAMEGGDQARTVADLPPADRERQTATIAIADLKVREGGKIRGKQKKNPTFRSSLDGATMQPRSQGCARHGEPRLEEQGHAWRGRSRASRERKIEQAEAIDGLRGSMQA